MAEWVERRRSCIRMIGVERRGAPLNTLLGHPLPNPTQLIDEDFLVTASSTGEGIPIEKRTGARNDGDEVAPGDH